MDITTEALVRAGFTRDHDKTTERWRLQTKWQTLDVYHQFARIDGRQVFNKRYRLAGILNTDDRVTVTSVEDLIEAAGLLGAEVDLLQELCLLYTSPSPRDVEESRMPSSA